MIQTNSSVVVPAISIRHDDFTHPVGRLQVDDALTKLASKANGLSLLQALNNNSSSSKGRLVEIKVTTDSSHAAAFLTREQRHKYKIDESEITLNNDKAVDILHRKGQGTSATVFWNPEVAVTLDAAGRPSLVYDAQKSYLVLAHELVHAHRILKGTYTGGVGDRQDRSTPAGKEELRAVGLGKYKNEKLSENGIRKEHGEPLRKSYNAAEE